MVKFLPAVFILILCYISDRVQPFFEFKTYNTSIDYVSNVTNGKTLLSITNSSPAPLPYYHDSDPRTDYYTFITHVKIMPLSSKYVRFVSDDYLYTLAVNGVQVPLDKIPGERRYDYNSGFMINLARYLTNGDNKLEMAVSDKNKGKYGLNVYSIPCLQNPYSLSFSFIILILLGISGYLFLTVFIKDRILLWIVFAGIALHVHYFGYTDYNVRTYDILDGNTGHINYIEYIVNNLSLPAPDRGWEYHQPPLYYASSAAVYKIGELLNVNRIYKLLQALTLVYFTGFLLFGTLILKRLFRKNVIFYLGVTMLFFWPSGFIHAVRIGNDGLLYFLFTGGIYFLQKYFLDKDIKAFYLFIIFAFLAIMTKSNAVILFGVMGLFLLSEIHLKRGWNGNHETMKKIGIIASVFLTGFMIHASVNYYYALKEGRADWYLAAFLNNPSQVSSGLYVGNGFINYLYFDLKTYLAEPFTSTWDDRFGRQYFWNFLLKSSLFGEFSFNGLYYRILAEIMSCILLSMAVTVISGFLIYIRDYFMSSNTAGKLLRMPLKIIPLIKRKGLEKLHVMSVTFFISIILMVLFRIRIPMSCLADFRYIYPVLPPFIAFYLFTMQQAGESGHNFMLMILFYQGIIFSVCSGLFFLGLPVG